MTYQKIFDNCSWFDSATHFRHTKWDKDQKEASQSLNRKDIGMELKKNKFPTGGINNCQHLSTINAPDV